MAKPPNNKNEDFILAQYGSLREEIRDRQNKRFQILTGSILGIPAIANLGVQFDLGIITFGIPPLIIVSALLYVSENNGTMRAGKFIRTQVEPTMGGASGWETWLEETATDDRRIVDKYVNWAFFSLMLLYFVFSLVFAYVYEPKIVSNEVKYLLLGGYIVGGAVALIKTWKESHFSSK